MLVGIFVFIIGCLEIVVVHFKRKRCASCGIREQEVQQSYSGCFALTLACKKDVRGTNAPDRKSIRLLYEQFVEFGLSRLKTKTKFLTFLCSMFDLQMDSDETDSPRSARKIRSNGRERSSYYRRAAYAVETINRPDSLLLRSRHSRFLAVKACVCNRPMLEVRFCAEINRIPALKSNSTTKMMVNKNIGLNFILEFM